MADAPVTNAYEFVSADASMNHLSNDGETLVTSWGARYRVLHLGGSSSRMAIAALRKVAALVEGGATVIGLAPIADPSAMEAGHETEWRALVGILWAGGGVTTLGKGRVIASDRIEDALRGIGIGSDFTFKGADDAQVLFHHRKLTDGDSYFLSSRKDRDETIEVHFRVTGKQPELWHAEPSRNAPASATLPTLAGLETRADPGIKYFSVIATYSKTFAFPKGAKQDHPLWLDLGSVHELAEVRVNGTLMGTAWQAPFRLDIGGAVKPGANKLEVRVANLWISRLIGDAQAGAKKVTWTALPTYRADAPLRPSGLIGPVTLLGQ